MLALRSELAEQRSLRASTIDRCRGLDIELQERRQHMASLEFSVQEMEGRAEQTASSKLELDQHMAQVKYLEQEVCEAKADSSTLLTRLQSLQTELTAECAAGDEFVRQENAELRLSLIESEQEADSLQELCEMRPRAYERWKQEQEEEREVKLARLRTVWQTELTTEMSVFSEEMEVREQQLLEEFSQAQVDVKRMQGSTKAKVDGAQSKLNAGSSPHASPQSSPRGSRQGSVRSSMFLQGGVGRTGSGVGPVRAPTSPALSASVGMMESRSPRVPVRNQTSTPPAQVPQISRAAAAPSRAGRGSAIVAGGTGSQSPTAGVGATPLSRTVPSPGARVMAVNSFGRAAQGAGAPSVVAR